MKRRKEILGSLLLLILGLGPRLALVFKFPTIPVSDFNNLINFGLYLRDHGLINEGRWFWEGFNVGLPLVLDGLFRIFPSADPAAVARLATAVACGLLPIVPFVIWRGVVCFRIRVLAGAALALWPGQVQFSGVVAQDNWVLLPTVALGALAVRALADRERAWPVTAGLLYAAGAAMRADLLLMLLPLLMAAVRVDLLRTRWRQVAAGGLAAGLALLGLAAYRHAASGRFSLSPEMTGLAVLGAYLPGSTVNGWEPPYAFIASVRPDLLRDRKALLAQTPGLAFQEALRRPGFHALRIFSMLGTFAMDGESMTLYWSLGSPEVLPAALHQPGAALAARLGPLVRLELAAMQALFLAAVMVGLRRRNMPVLVLASAVVLKYGLHAFGVFQGRYFMVATAIEILAIAMAAEEVLRPAVPGRWPLLARSLAAGAACGLGLFFFAPRLSAFVLSRDVDLQQHTYHFFLTPPDKSAELACLVDHGLLSSLWPGLNATLRTLKPDPSPGDQAVAVCELTGRGAPRPLILQVLDSYAPGGLGGRMVQRVEVDGAEVFSNDIAREPWSGWTDIPLGSVGSGTKRSVVIEVQAIRPDPGAGWGDHAQTTFQLAGGPPVMHLAMARPTAQSSTLAGFATAGARAAADGKTDGNFFDGSVTSTNRDANAWWQVDLLTSLPIGSIAVWNRTDCCPSRLSDYWVFLSDTPFSPTDTPAMLQKRAGTWKSHQTSVPNPSTTIRTAGAKGRYVRVQLTGTDYLSLAEVQVFGQ